MSTSNKDNKNKKVNIAAFGAGMVAGAGMGASAAELADEIYSHDEAQGLTPLEDAADEIDIIDESEMTGSESTGYEPLEAHRVDTPIPGPVHHTSEPSVEPAKETELYSDLDSEADSEADSDSEIELISELEDDEELEIDLEPASESPDDEIFTPEKEVSELELDDKLDDELEDELDVLPDDIIEDEIELVDDEVPMDEGADGSELDIDLQLLGSETVTLEDGTQSDMAYFQAAGRLGAIVDVDRDGRADFLMYDANANGDIEEEEIMDLRQDEVLMAALEEEDTPIDMSADDNFALNDDDGDYINDANVDDFFQA